MCGRYRNDGSAERGRFARQHPSVLGGGGDIFSEDPPFGFLLRNLGCHRNFSYYRRKI